MAAAAVPVMNGAARLVIEGINQYRHGLLTPGSHSSGSLPRSARLLVILLITLLVHRRRFGLHRNGGFGRGSRIFDLRNRAFALFARSIAGGLFKALFDRLRLSGGDPGDFLFDILPGSLYRLLFNLLRRLMAVSAIL